MEAVGTCINIWIHIYIYTYGYIWKPEWGLVTEDWQMSTKLMGITVRCIKALQKKCYTQRCCRPFPWALTSCVARTNLWNSMDTNRYIHKTTKLYRKNVSFWFWSVFIILRSWMILEIHVWMPVFLNRSRHLTDVTAWIGPACPLRRTHYSNGNDHLDSPSNT